jgi:hypothetical protein
MTTIAVNLRPDRFCRELARRLGLQTTGSFALAN